MRNSCADYRTIFARESKFFDAAAQCQYIFSLNTRRGHTMSGVNKVILIGNLGSDPEIRYTDSGAAIGNITVATSESWKDKNSGERIERTEWHRVVLFRRLAEVAGEYLRKGAKVYIEGKLQTRKWQDQNGNDRYTTEIVARDLQMLGSRGDGSAGRSSGGQAASHADPNPAPAIIDDDIPF